ncbi:unnamed protein product [marine sediment metagenome]|uniref:Uncharacterized protein n=1 Tax=marine sediment metagenome TaxID=412755 RepID=X0SZ99_9ZZZZ
MSFNPLSNQTRLFCVIDNKREFLRATLPWRIMWRGGEHRAILRERVTGKESFLNDFPHGCVLDLLGGACRDPSSGYEGVWLYRFIDCEVNRSWVPVAGALSSLEAHSLDYWVEIKCQILTTMLEFKEG